MTVRKTLCPKTLADIQSSKGEHIRRTLSWVGMEQIALPIEIAGRPLNARVNAGINLLAAPQAAKGIHMSRLYLLLDQLTQQEITPELLRQTLGAFLDSHGGQSDSASLSLAGDLLLSRKSLVSNHFGWKAYPIEIQAELTDVFSTVVQVAIPYSSTCPASAALSRQLSVEQFQLQFAQADSEPALEEVSLWLAERGMPATPHSQRSWAKVSIRLGQQASEIPIMSLIARCESALATPVQTVVKRQDEQAFALANGQNLMFCEDAVRRLEQVLSGADFCEDFAIQVEHQESLHAHNAVARIDWKGTHHAA